MIYLNKEDKVPLYMQIYEQVKTEILNGTLREGQTLTGSRGLAKTLNISRNTVDNAYSQLLAEGYVESRKGIGYIVTKLSELDAFKNKAPQNVIKKQLINVEQGVIYDLTNSSYTSDLFPKRMWKRYTLEALEMLEKEAKISVYHNKQGELYLRQNLLRYLERIRGVHCVEDQIIVTCGIQQSLDYICKILLS
ncbi:GntR family transcriptional regulator [Anaerosacchariphilus polymeriproducens]|uniref:GntR family transcriptional regulator n=1 Tax=Anaerosacchariphilus polymeriproducens TaxID=1812858 RepID=UPI001F1BED62|nr:GntR family transcriptional regulator [Anaerosacchariphilus polymeriproducens]